MYTEVRTSEENGQEVFLTDDRPINITDGVTRRMMHPRDCMAMLEKRKRDCEDLHFSSSFNLNLRIVEGGPTPFAIQPTVREGQIAEAIQKDGLIFISPKALNQMCSLMQVKGPKRYERMVGDGNKKLVQDFHEMFARIPEREPKLVARTNIERGSSRRVVEGFMRDNVDRTQSVSYLASVLQHIMEYYGNVIRGVETFESPTQGGSEFRILFGNPLLQEKEPNPLKRLYAMMRVSCSDIGEFKPSCSLGIFRMFCANGCTTQEFPHMNFRMGGKDNFSKFESSLDEMMSLAIPYGAFLALAIQESQHRMLPAGPIQVLDRLNGKGIIKESLHECASNRLDSVLEDGPIETEWDFINWMTDSAKGLGSLAAKRNAESRALMLGVYEGGIGEIYERGFDRSAFESSVRKRCNEMVEPFRRTRSQLMRTPSLN
jgi:hypothetical protein